LEPEILRARHKEEVLKLIDRQIRDIGYRMEQCEEREEQEEQARQSAALLPSAETSEKILRYENALERQLFRVMHHLERLQRRRQGENIPVPVTVDVSRI
jgi:branched-subunit amino acid aminotransferase/4-amino-4-deoxychorismate lyase